MYIAIAKGWFKRVKTQVNKYVLLIVRPKSPQAIQTLKFMGVTSGQRIENVGGPCKSLKKNLKIMPLHELKYYNR